MEKWKIKTVIFDIDNTLSYHSKLKPKSLEALKLCHEAKLEIAIATGRPMCIINEDIKNIPFINYFILSNGSVIYDVKNNKNYTCPIPKKDALDLIKALKPYTKSINIHTTSKLLNPINNYIHLMKKGYLNALLISNDSSNLVKNIFPIPSTSSAIRFGITPQKLNIKFESPQIMENAKHILDEFSDRFEYAFVSDTNVETTKKGIDKGSALIKLCDIANIPIENTIAFGDSENDLSIFKIAGHSISIGNSCKELLKLSNHISPSIKEDGVLEGVKYMLDKMEGSK